MIERISGHEENTGPGLANLAKRSFFSVFLATLFLSIFISPSAHGRDKEYVPKEYIVKAAMIYKMLGFITWPDAEGTSKNPINICVYGKNPFGRYIYALEAERFDSRGINVRTGSRLEDLSDCHVLFISSSEKDRLGNLLPQVEGKPVLTISDIKDFSLSGGMIEFIKTDRRIAFIINYGKVLDAGIRISSRLLKISIKVYDRDGRVIWSQNGKKKRSN